MKKLVITFIILLNVFLISGCSSTTGSLTKGQQRAVSNSIEFIRNSSFDSKGRINTEILKIENVDEAHRTEVRLNGSKVDESQIDLTDWIITIGDTSQHDFAVIVCDSRTYKVIGYIPIE